MNVVIATQPAKTHMVYRGEKIPVIVESTFAGANGMIANVKAVEGYPFLSSDVQAQGETYGSWNCNGYRVRADFVMIEPTAVELASALDLDPQAEARETERDLRVFGPVEPWGEFTHEDWLDEKRTQEEARF